MSHLVTRLGGGIHEGLKFPAFGRGFCVRLTAELVSISFVVSLLSRAIEFIVFVRVRRNGVQCLAQIGVRLWLKASLI